MTYDDTCHNFGMKTITWSVEPPHDTQSELLSNPHVYFHSFWPAQTLAPLENTPVAIASILNWFSSTLHAVVVVVMKLELAGSSPLFEGVNSMHLDEKAR